MEEGSTIQKKARKLSSTQLIITKHVAEMHGCYDKNAWQRESRICSALVKKYGKDFLLWVPPPEGCRVSSLTFYYSVFGKNYLSDKLVDFHKQKNHPLEKPEIPLSTHKIGEDVSELQIQTPKTLKDFLIYGETLKRQRDGSDRTDTGLPQSKQKAFPQ